MKRAAVYARYSTDLQNDRSIEDQIVLCRDFASRNGYQVVATFSDRAITGASLIERDGLLELLAASRRQPAPFVALIVEHPDRIARDMADGMDVHRKLTFAGVEIVGVNTGGAVSTVAMAVHTLSGQFQREEGAKKIRRGLAGVVRSGRAAGGLAFGYRVVNTFDERGNPVRGLREIDLERADIVRRIYAEYLAGPSPRLIAAGLNRDRVPPPRGRLWNATTINGYGKRGSGILHNQLYAGLIVWNKNRKLLNPYTGKRVGRPNDAADRQVVEVEQLRIIDQDTWQAVQALKASKAGTRPEQHRRPVHLLSGLLRCSHCGSGMSVKDRDHNGKIRVRCSAVAESGSCENRRAIYLPHIEAAVVGGMRDQLREPRLIELYVTRYNETRQETGGYGRPRPGETRDRLGAGDP